MNVICSHSTVSLFNICILNTINKTKTVYLREERSQQERQNTALKRAVLKDTWLPTLTRMWMKTEKENSKRIKTEKRRYSDNNRLQKLLKYVKVWHLLDKKKEKEHLKITRLTVLSN